MSVVPAKVRVPPFRGLDRERLTALLGQIWLRRAGLLVAPAGSGKTSLLAAFAATAGAPVAWYRAEAWEAEEAPFLRHVEAAVRGVVPGLAGAWATVEDAARALDGVHPDRVLLIIDDLHALEGTPAEAALGRLIDYGPRWLHILLGSRGQPGFNLSRLRVDGELLEVGADDLRFRAWEVERLFRDVYRDPVPPTDLAVLARRTEGWAAGLQLFHLATRGKSTEERRRILAGGGSSTRLVRDYLARNVLAELPDELGTFLLGTCVLGRLTGPICDRLLARRGSAQVLEELARRQIFTSELDDEDGSFRYHEVFRAQLDRMLVEAVGEEEAKARYARAGELLEEAGALAEALAAYCRAEAWGAVRALLGGQGERIADGPRDWLETLPPAIVRHEPWLALAAARRARADGRWEAALEAYARAEAGFGTSSAASTSRAERLALGAWLDPVAMPPSDWTRRLRAGLVREPLTVARDATRVGSVGEHLPRGLLALAAGDVALARRELALVDDDPGTGGALAAAARLALGVATVLGGDDRGVEAIAAAGEHAERIGAVWLARLAGFARALAPDVSGVAPGEPGPSAVPGSGRTDPWGGALADFISAAATSASSAPGAGPEFRLVAAERAALGFRQLGSGVLEAWARGFVALAHAELGSPDAREAAIAAESLARATGAAGVRLLAYRALAAVDPAHREEYLALAEAVERETGLGGALFRPRPAAAVDDPPAPSAAAVSTSAASAVGAPGSLAGARIRTLGGFALEIGRRPVRLDPLKPRARALLRLLAVAAGTPVHREVIGEALWPETDAQASARSLHVAVSTIRGLLGEAFGADGAAIVVREGDAYRLGLDPEAVDLTRFERALAEGRALRGRGEPAAAAFRAALALYHGDLLPEEGPAEWVVDRREHYRGEVVEAARAIAEEALLAGDHRTAIETCRAGLQHDRFHDPLWRLLIEARDRAGDIGAASRDRREYEGILAALGVPERPRIGAS